MAHDDTANGGDDRMTDDRDTDEMDLEELRSEIRAIDREIVELIARPARSITADSWASSVVGIPRSRLTSAMPSAT